MMKMSTNEMTRRKTDLYYVHLFNDFSGSPRVLRDAIDSELNEPKNTFVFTSAHAGFLDGVNAQRVNFFYRRSSNRYIQLLYFFISQCLLFWLLGFYLVKSLVKGHQATVVINTMLPFGAGLVAKIMRAKVVYYVHETFITPLLFKKFLRFFIDHCALHVIFVSKYLQTVEPFSKPIQNVIYNGLRSDFSLINVIDEKNKFSNKQLFFAGSLKLYKGVEQLISIAELLPEFKVIAAINCENFELDYFLKQRNIPDNMLFYARPDNIQEHFSRSFAVFNLSLPDGWVETFGLSLIEGMAFGCPVIAPPVGGPVEFVNDTNGFLIDAREITKIVDFIHYLNSDFSVWCSYSKQAFITSKRFTAVEYKKLFKCYFEHNNLV